MVIPLVAAILFAAQIYLCSYPFGCTVYLFGCPVILLAAVILSAVQLSLWQIYSGWETNEKFTKSVAANDLWYQGLEAAPSHLQIFAAAKTEE